MDEINMAEIMITGNRVLIDDDDLPVVYDYNWLVSTHGYVIRNIGGGRMEYLHVAIMHPPSGIEVDHRNRNTLDNRRSNLRLCTHAQNAQNLSQSIRNTSGYRGVSFDKRSGRWDARGYVNGKQYWLGYFDTPEEANTVVIKWRRKYMPFSHD